MVVFRASEISLDNVIVRLFVCYKALVCLFVFDEHQDITYQGCEPYIPPYSCIVERLRAGTEHAEDRIT